MQKNSQIMSDQVDLDDNIRNIEDRDTWSYDAVEIDSTRVTTSGKRGEMFLG